MNLKKLKLQVSAAYLVYRRKEIPWYKKAFLLMILAYALSPIDLIPDFIPVIGYLDDAVLIPLGIWLALKMIPHALWEECLIEAETAQIIDKRVALFGAILILIIWIAAIGLLLNKWVFTRT